MKYMMFVCTDTEPDAPTGDPKLDDVEDWVRAPRRQRRPRARRAAAPAGGRHDGAQARREGARDRRAVRRDARVDRRVRHPRVRRPRRGDRDRRRSTRWPGFGRLELRPFWADDPAARRRDGRRARPRRPRALAEALAGGTAAHRRHADPHDRGLGPRRGRRRRRRRAGAAALAARTAIPDNPAAWLTTTARRRAIDVLRRADTERTKLAEVAMTEDSTGDEPTTPSRPHRRRPAAARVHVLPPGAVDGGPGRADAQGRLQPVDGGDRPRLPDVREHDGPAAAAGQAEDRQRRHPLPRPARRGAPRAPRRRARRDLPRLHGGLRGGGRRRPRRRGDPARPAARRADAGLRRGAGAARPDAAPARPAGRATRRRRAGHAGGPGPLAVGHRRDHRGAARSSPARRRAGPLPGPGRARRRPRHAPPTADDTDWPRIVALYDELPAISTRRPWSRSTGRSRSACATARSPGSPPSTAVADRLPAAPTTSCTPPAATCWPGPAGHRKQSRPWTGRSRLAPSERERQQLARRREEIVGGH